MKEPFCHVCMFCTVYGTHCSSDSPDRKRHLKGQHAATRFSRTEVARTHLRWLLRHDAVTHPLALEAAVERLDFACAFLASSPGVTVIGCEHKVRVLRKSTQQQQGGHEPAEGRLRESGTLQSRNRTEETRIDEAKESQNITHPTPASRE